MSPKPPTEARQAELDLLDLANRVGIGNDAVNGSRKLQTYFVIKAKQLLAAGVDANCRDDEGRDCYDLLAQVGDGHRKSAHSLSKLLIDHGYEIIDRGGLIKSGGPLRDTVSDLLARRERDGLGIRGKQGDNLLHHLAEHEPGVLTALLISRMGQGDHGKPPIRTRTNVNEGRSSDGATPLHVLWRRCRAGEMAHVGEQFACWEFTCYLGWAGADLATVDKDGVSVLDLIDECLWNGIIPKPTDKAPPAYSAYAANIESILMERRTRVPSEHNRGKAARL